MNRRSIFALVAGLLAHRKAAPSAPGPMTDAVINAAKAWAGQALTGTDEEQSQLLVDLLDTTNRLVLWEAGHGK